MHIPNTGGWNPLEGVNNNANLIWDTVGLAWVKATGSLTGGGNVTVNNFPTTQAISASALPLPNGAATEATLAKIPGIGIAQFDYCSLSQTATQDVWMFKIGGAGGTLVNTVTINYTDSTKITVANVSKT